MTCSVLSCMCILTRLALWWFLFIEPDRVFFLQMMTQFFVKCNNYYCPVAVAQFSHVHVVIINYLAKNILFISHTVVCFGQLNGPQINLWHSSDVIGTNTSFCHYPRRRSKVVMFSVECDCLKHVFFSDFIMNTCIIM